jgi:hypothetical protein
LVASSFARSQRRSRRIVETVRRLHLFVPFRIPLARGYGEKKHLVFKELFCHDDLNARSCRPSRKRRLPALGGGGVAAMINLRTAFSGGADLPFPPTLPLPLHHLDPGLFDPASMAIELINYMVVPDSPRNPSLVDR